MPTTKNKVGIEFTGTSQKLERAVNKSERKIKRFGGTVRNVNAKVKAFGGTVAGRFKGLGTDLRGLGLGGLASAAALVIAGKKVVDFDSRLASLAIQAKITKREAFELKDQIFKIAVATRQKPGALLAGIETIVEKTGNLKFAVDSLKDLGIVATASSTPMKAIAATASNLQEKLGLEPDQVIKAFDILSAQGKKGAFTLQNMAGLFEVLLSAASRFQIKGVAGLRTFGAFLQIARRGVGSSEQAATAVERTISDLLEKRKQITGLIGFDIVDVEATNKAGETVLKDFDVVLKEIIRKTNGNIFQLQKIFGIRAIRAITPLVESFKKFGDFREMEKFAKFGGDGVAIMEDFNKKLSFSSEKLKEIGVILDKLADKILTKPIDDFASALKAIGPTLEDLSKSPFFDRLLEIGPVVGFVTAIATKLGFIQATLVAIVGLTTGGVLGEIIKAELQRKGIKPEHIFPVFGVPSPIPTPALPIPPIPKLLHPRAISREAPRVDLFGVKQPLPRGLRPILGPPAPTALLPEYIKQTIIIKISDKKVSVISDKGVTPKVKVAREDKGEF